MEKFFTCLFVITSIFTQAYGQIEWTKHSESNPVFPRGTGGEWDDQLLTGPYVLFDGSVYHMWYGGYDGGNGGSRIGYAYSSDGIIWTRESNNPVLESGPSGSWDEDTVYQPCVLFDGTTYHMWFGGHSGPTRQIGYATSPDSINWTKNLGNPVLKPGLSGSWDDEFVDSPDVLFIDGVYHMWYSGSDGTKTQSGHATSPDGINWTKDSDNNPVLEPDSSGRWDDIMSYQPSVLFDGTTYHMWYSGGGAFLWSIGYAHSSDGIIWTKDSDNNPVLEPGSSGSWDDTYVGLCGVTFNVDSSRFKMWFAGGNGFLFGDIGYAISDSIVSDIDYKPGELPQGFSLLQNYPNPFNPSTTIEFTLPKSEFVELKVYNILGKEVASLVSNILNQGNHTYQFDGKNLASGVYYYKIQAGEYREVKKMILIK